jgi:hypothetical protein
VEIWFNRITQPAIRRGAFRSVKDLVEKIHHHVKNSNRHAQPFVWTATASNSERLSLPHSIAQVWLGRRSRPGARSLSQQGYLSS